MTYLNEAVQNDLKDQLDDLTGLPIETTLLLDGKELADLDHDIRVTVKFEKTTLRSTATGSFADLETAMDQYVKKEERNEKEQG